MSLKDDTRPAKGGWAPGGYLCECMNCKCQFSGDKRAVQCADCAYTDQLSYGELVYQIGRAPTSWLPALLIHAVDTCVQRKVFRDDQALLGVVNKAATAAHVLEGQ